MTDQPKIFSIPDYNMPIVEEKIAKLNKRAAKLGAEPITITVVRKWEHVIRYPFDEDHVLSAGEVKEVIPTTDIRVIGKAPQLNGWSLIAVVEPVVGGNLLRKFPGTEIEIPMEFRDVTPDRCDHCHTVRQRNETFIVHHQTNGWKVVGRTCLADFTGINSPEKIANYAAALCDLFAGFNEDEKVGGGNHGGEYFAAPVRSFLKMVAIHARRNGFVTSKAAYESNGEKLATGKFVFSRIFMVDSPDRAKDVRKFYESITDTEEEDATNLVDAAMQYGKTQFVDEKEENLSDFGHNMKLLLAANYVRIKDAGYVSSIIPIYQRSLTKVDVDYSKSQHVGEIGAKVTTPVKVTKVFTWEGSFGPVEIVTMVSDEGNVLTWFAPVGKSPKVGDYKVLTAKIKRHDNRNGYKTTVVNYPKFL